MGKATGFFEYGREKAKGRPFEERKQDWNEVYLPFPEDKLQTQGARCMNCGIPFCHSDCPLGNFIPDWNDLVYRNRWEEASDRLHATNNFPEFTGRLCPAPCEGACVLGINKDPVTIKQIEVSIIDKAFEEGWVRATPPDSRTDKSIAIVGSGPAGLAAAQQLNRAGHTITVFERDDRLGGLLRYGIPEFKKEKKFLDRRIEIMEEEGIIFKTGCEIGGNISAGSIKEEFDAMVLAGGAKQPRDLPIPGRELNGIYFAMEFLPLQNRICEGDPIPEQDVISAKDKNVIIIGGGDTGADCLGTSIRQGAKEIHQLEILPKPPLERDSEKNPWPLYPNVFRVSSAHEEGGERLYSVSTKCFEGTDGKVEKLQIVNVESKIDENGRMNFNEVEGSNFELKADLVLLAMGFLGPEQNGLLKELNIDVNERTNVKRDQNWMTNVPGIFTAGDMQRGQSLIVWAIAEGRSCAQAVDSFLMGKSELPAPLS